MQWRTQADLGRVQRVTWVCGTEPVLMEDVVRTVKSLLEVREEEYVDLRAGQNRDRDVWAAINQYPFIPTSNRLVVVRDADKLKSWDPMKNWLANSRFLPTVYVLFVSERPSVYNEELRDGKTVRVLPGYIELIKERASLVECRTPAYEVSRDKWGKPRRVGPPDIVLWVQRYATVTPETAMYLLDRCAGDLGYVRNVCRKGAVLSGEMTRAAVDLLTSEQPSKDFARHVVRLERVQALRDIEMVPLEDYRKTLAYIEYKLAVMVRLNRQVRARKPYQELTRGTDFNHYDLSEMYSVAKFYDPKRLAACLSVLALTDDAVRSGATTGTLESLVVAW